MSTQKIEAAAPFVRGARPASRNWSYGVLLMDVAMVVAAAIAGTIFAPEQPTSVPYLVLFGLLTLGFFTAARSYRHRLTIAVLDEVAICFGVSAVAAMSVTSLESLLSEDAVGAGNAVRLWCFAAIYLSAGRTGLLLAQKGSRKRGEGMEPTLIVGAGQVGSLVFDRLEAHPELRARARGFPRQGPVRRGRDGERPSAGSELGPRAHRQAARCQARRARVLERAAQRPARPRGTVRGREPPRSPSSLACSSACRRVSTSRT